MGKPSKRQFIEYGSRNERRKAPPGEEGMLTVGSDAPDFVLENSAGQSHHLAEALTYGPVILAFFKADCATCQIAFPYLERLYQTYRGERWHIWGICQHPPRAADWFAKTNGITFPLLIDDEGFPVSNLYDPEATPTIFLIDAQGVIRDGFFGFTKDSLNTLAGELAEMLGQEAVRIALPDDGKPSFRPG